MVEEGRGRDGRRRWRRRVNVWHCLELQQATTVTFVLVVILSRVNGVHFIMDMLGTYLASLAALGSAQFPSWHNGVWRQLSLNQPFFPRLVS